MPSTNFYSEDDEKEEEYHWEPNRDYALVSSSSSFSVNNERKRNDEKRRESALFTIQRLKEKVVSGEKRSTRNSRNNNNNNNSRIRQQKNAHRLLLNTKNTARVIKGGRKGRVDRDAAKKSVFENYRFDCDDEDEDEDEEAWGMSVGNERDEHSGESFLLGKRRMRLDENDACERRYLIITDDDDDVNGTDTCECSTTRRRERSGYEEQFRVTHRLLRADCHPEDLLGSDRAVDAQIANAVGWIEEENRKCDSGSDKAVIAQLGRGSVLFTWQQYENMHVRASEGGDELLAGNRFCLGEMDDDENEDGESDNEANRGGNRFSLLNKTMSYCASYWDAASEELVSSHAHALGSDSATSGESFRSGSRRRRRVRTQTASPWPNTSVAPYVAVVGEKIFLRMFDCNNKKEANLYRNNKVIKSVRMYGQFGSVVAHQKDFILEGSICKFPKDCFDDHLRSMNSSSSAPKISNLFFQLEFEDEDGLQLFSAPKPCLLCMEKESAEQFQAFLMEPTMFGKKFKNKIDRLCSRCGFVKDVGTVFTLWHTGLLYGDLGGHPLSAVVTQCSSDPTFARMCPTILIELQAIQIDVVCWSMEVKKIPDDTGEEKGQDSYFGKNTEWYASITNVMLVDPTWSSYSQLCGKLLLIPFVFIPLKFMGNFLFIIFGHAALVPQQLSERNERNAIRAVGPSTGAFKDDMEAFELYRGYMNALVLDKCRFRSLNIYVVLNLLFGMKYASQFSSEIVSPVGIWGRIAVPVAFISVVLGVHIVHLFFKRDISIFGYWSGRKQDLFDRYKRSSIISIVSLSIVCGAHGSIMRYQRASVEKFCSLRPPQYDYDTNGNGVLRYDCNDMLRVLFRQECLHLFLVFLVSVIHSSYPKKTRLFPVSACISGFLAYFPPQFSTFMDPPEEVNVETLFNLYGIVAILCMIISIITALNVQVFFKRQSLDWYLGSYLYQTMRSRRGKEA